MKLWHAGCVVASLLAVALPTSDARAQAEPAGAAPDAAARAREDFREGLALMAAGDYAGALAKFNAVAQYKQTAQVMFNIAECEERLGRLVRALGDYRLALGKAQDGSAPKVAELAPARIAALEPRIAKLVVVRVEGTPNPGARVELDGVEIAAGQGEAPLPVDPGERVLRVVVGSAVHATERVTLAEGESKTVRVEVPAPEAVSAGGRTGAGPSVPGIALVVGGGVSLAVGAVFLGLRQGAIGELDDLCGGDTSCPPSAEPTADRGRTFTGVAQIAIPVGVVAATVGVVLLVTGGGATAEESASARLRVLPAAPGADGPGASLAWTF